MSPANTFSPAPISARPAPGNELTNADLWSITGTVLVGIVLAVLAYFSAERYGAGRGWVIGLAVGVAG